jgi:ABC-type phosphate transport system substrate-binding protein
MPVSLPLTIERGRLRAALVALCAMTALAVVATAAPSAHADFTVAKCQGSAIQGEGSSLQTEAQAFWTNDVFYTSFGCESGAVISSPVTYDPSGSGCGLAAMGAGPTSGTCFSKKGSEYTIGYRDPAVRFGGSDAPPTPVEEANIDAAGSEHPGSLHVIPVASAAIAVIVHFPEGCELKSPGTGASSENNDTSTGGPNDPASAKTGDTAANHDLRVHITAEELEKIWDGTAQTWGEVVPGAGNLLGTDTNTVGAGGGLNNGIACANVPVRRIVRLDGSGTTYNFKAYLSLLPGAPSGLWTSAPVAGTGNVWPVTTSSKTTPEEVVKATAVCEDISDICHGTENGGGALTAAVNATDGSIGYVDLATARKKGFTVTPTTSGTPDHTYWIPLQTINPSKGNEVGSNFVEPTINPLSNLSTETERPGANCTNADYRGYPEASASDPDPTLGSWTDAIATGSKDTTTYAACALTYDFAFDDDAPVYGNTQAEQEKARTVKDYLESVVSPTGQIGVLTADYGALPSNVVQIAQKGVEAIGWNKSAGAGGGTKEEPVKAPTTTTTTTTTTSVITPAITAPSNSFSIASAKVKGKDIVLSLVLPGAGQVQIKATGGGVTVSNVTASVGGGQGTVTLPISSAALKKLAKSKSKKLSVSITVTFTPTGGTASTQKKTLTVTQASIASKGKKTKKKGKKG